MRRLLLFLGSVILAVLVAALVLLLGYSLLQALAGWKYFAALTCLFLMATAIMVILLTLHRSISMDLEEEQSVLGRVFLALGNSIHSLLLTNNGWFVIFLTMAMLSLGIAFYTQFGDPPMMDQTAMAQTKNYSEHTSEQKAWHALLDWDVRKDSPTEKSAAEKTVQEYQQDFPNILYRWPWWVCALIMFMITALSIPVVLADEAREIWQRMREHHAHGPHGDEAAHHSAMANFLDRLFHHHHAPVTTPGGTTQPQPTGQTTQPTVHSTSFGQLLLMEFAAELLGNVFEGLVSHRAH